MEDVALSYGERTVLEKWSMHIDQGERVLLAGGNGSGKSTVLRAILGAASGEDTCLAGGRIDLAPGLVLSYVPQDPGGLSGNLRDLARERGMDLTLFMALLRKMDFSRTQFEKPMEDYSLGQKKKVLLAASLSQQAHLYIWDEPMNYIDIFSRGQIAGLIQKYSPTMLLVEHDRAFAESVSTRRIYLSSRSSD